MLILLAAIAAATPNAHDELIHTWLVTVLPFELLVLIILGIMVIVMSSMAKDVKEQGKTISKVIQTTFTQLMPTLLETAQKDAQLAKNVRKQEAIEWLTEFLDGLSSTQKQTIRDKYLNEDKAKDTKPTDKVNLPPLDREASLEAGIPLFHTEEKKPVVDKSEGVKNIVVPPQPQLVPDKRKASRKPKLA